MSRYQDMFDRLDLAGEIAFGAFVMPGDPDLAVSEAILDAAVEGGADMIEVGIPFSDPIADGPVIQAAAVRALSNSVVPADCFALLRRFRDRHPTVPVGLLTYANLVLARGRDSFYASAAEAGIDSVLIADVPMFEAEPFLACARRHGIAPVMIAAPNTPDATLCAIAQEGEGYTYCVARAGVTGADEQVRFDQTGMLDRLRSFGAPPPVFGFGISRPEHVGEARLAGAAGVISGSAIAALVAVHKGAEAEAVKGFVARMKSATRCGPPRVAEADPNGGRQSSGR